MAAPTEANRAAASAAYAAYAAAAAAAYVSAAYASAAYAAYAAAVFPPAVAAASAASAACAASAAVDAAARSGKWKWLYRTYHRSRGMDNAQFDPFWKTRDAVVLATRIMETRDFTTFPILADALEDAGCDASLQLGAMRYDHEHHTAADWSLWNLLGYDVDPEDYGG